jgi:hypothetical protein
MVDSLEGILEFIDNFTDASTMTQGNIDYLLKSWDVVLRDCYEKAMVVVTLGEGFNIFARVVESLS